MKKPSAWGRDAWLYVAAMVLMSVGVAMMVALVFAVFGDSVTQ